MLGNIWQQDALVNKAAVFLLPSVLRLSPLLKAPPRDPLKAPLHSPPPTSQDLGLYARGLRGGATWRSPRSEVVAITLARSREPSAHFSLILAPSLLSLHGDQDPYSSGITAQGAGGAGRFPAVSPGTIGSVWVPSSLRGASVRTQAAADVWVGPDSAGSTGRGQRLLRSRAEEPPGLGVHPELPRESCGRAWAAGSWGGEGLRPLSLHLTHCATTGSPRLTCFLEQKQ